MVTCQVCGKVGYWSDEWRRHYGEFICPSCLEKLSSMSRHELFKAVISRTVERDALAVTVAKLRGILGRTRKQGESTR